MFCGLCVFPAECGPGVQRRHVFCRATDGDYTSDDRCTVLAPKPADYRACDVTCQVDCRVDSWSQWGSCSQLCGLGKLQVFCFSMASLMTSETAVLTASVCGSYWVYNIRIPFL